MQRRKLLRIILLIILRNLSDIGAKIKRYFFSGCAAGDFYAPLVEYVCVFVVICSKEYILKAATNVDQRRSPFSERLKNRTVGRCRRRDRWVKWGCSSSWYSRWRRQWRRRLWMWTIRQELPCNHNIIHNSWFTLLWSTITDKDRRKERMFPVLAYLGRVTPYST